MLRLCGASVRRVAARSSGEGGTAAPERPLWGGSRHARASAPPPKASAPPPSEVAARTAALQGEQRLAAQAALDDRESQRLAYTILFVPDSRRQFLSLLRERSESANLVAALDKLPQYVGGVPQPPPRPELAAAQRLRPLHTRLPLLTRQQDKS